MGGKATFAEATVNGERLRRISGHWGAYGLAGQIDRNWTFALDLSIGFEYENITLQLPEPARSTLPT